MSNFKQIATGYSSYALDHNGQICESGTDPPSWRYWYAQPTNPSLSIAVNNPAVQGPALEYLSKIDNIFSCPTNRRRTTAQVSFTDPRYQGQQVLFNEFLTRRYLNFDYTMAVGSGAGGGHPRLFQRERELQHAWEHTKEVYGVEAQEEPVAVHHGVSNEDLPQRA
jgi:hypothetical protein